MTKKLYCCTECEEFVFAEEDIDRALKEHYCFAKCIGGIKEIPRRLACVHCGKLTSNEHYPFCSTCRKKIHPRKETGK